MTKHTYTGILCDFSLNQMKQNNSYKHYVLGMLSAKDWWFSMNVAYSCITNKSFIEWENKFSLLNKENNSIINKKLEDFINVFRNGTRKNTVYFYLQVK